jgi:hypothetical protein
MFIGMVIGAAILIVGIHFGGMFHKPDHHRRRGPALHNPSRSPTPCRFYRKAHSRIAGVGSPNAAVCPRAHGIADRCRRLSRRWKRNHEPQARTLSVRPRHERAGGND